MIKLIIFDMDNTINNWDSSMYSEQISKLSGVPVSKVDPFITGLVGKLDRANISTKEFESVVAKKFKVTASKIGFYECYKRNVKVKREMINIIKRLKKRYKIGLLTNSDRDRYSYTAKIVNMKLFDYRFVSSFIKIAKPHLNAYMHVLKNTGMKADEILFIDNNLRNVKAARSIGIKSIQFRGVRRLEKDLDRLEIW